MHKRKLLTGLVLASILLAGFGASTMPASADPRTLLVTLTTGEQITVQVDAAPGTPVEDIPLPPTVLGEIKSVQDVTVPLAQQAPTPDAPTPAPVTATAPSTPQPQPATPAPAAQAPQTPASGAAAPPIADAAPQVTVQTQQPSKSAKGRSKAQDKLEGSDGAKRTSNDPKRKRASKAKHDPAADTAIAPSAGDPTLSLAVPGAAPIGVPNFFIDRFRIPPFLLPIYQAAGIEYGVRWEILAAINEIETDYGRNLNVSTAGALGWMQFMPATWEQYGVDANQDGRKDPYNPVDAIFAAARYLKAAGVDTDVKRAIFAYNHADWYVDSVLVRARLLGGLPADLVGSLTGLTQGHFPVHASARYVDDLDERRATKRVGRGENAAVAVDATSGRRAINIFADAGSPVVAVQDGKIVKMGANKRLGRYIQLRDAYGNTYTYARLKKIAERFPVAKSRRVSEAAVKRELKLPKGDTAPKVAASAGSQEPVGTQEPAAALSAQTRLYADPDRATAFSAAARARFEEAKLDGYTTFKSFFTEVYGLKRSDVRLSRLGKGSKVIAGTILGRIGSNPRRSSPHMLFEIRPAGRGAPRVDPKPILDGWKLLESTAIYRAAGKSPFWGDGSQAPTIGQVMLMSKEALQQRVLSDPDIDIYACGRRDIRAGIVDRRVLATLEFLALSALKPTVTSLHCGHGFYTASGNVSEHSSGSAVDIAAINGIPIAGHQGPGSITDTAVRRLLTLQGTMKPHQIITLMKYEDTDNTLALADHDDHIHVGFQPLFGTNTKLGAQLGSVLKPGQWTKLIARLGRIENPTVRTKPSRYAIKVHKRPAGASHAGD